MTTLTRQTLLDEVMARLTGLPLVGANVFEYRGIPIARGALPAISVEAQQEPHEADSKESGVGEWNVLRSLEIAVVVVATSRTEREAVCQQVELAMGTPLQVSGELIDFDLTGVGFQTAGDPREAVLVLGDVVLTENAIFFASHSYVAEYSTLQTGQEATK